MTTKQPPALIAHFDLEFYFEVSEGATEAYLWYKDSGEPTTDPAQVTIKEAIQITRTRRATPQDFQFIFQRELDKTNCNDPGEVFRNALLQYVSILRDTYLVAIKNAAQAADSFRSMIDMNLVVLTNQFIEWLESLNTTSADLVAQSKNRRAAERPAPRLRFTDLLMPNKREAWSEFLKEQFHLSPTDEKTKFFGWALVLLDQHRMLVTDILVDITQRELFDILTAYFGETTGSKNFYKHYAIRESTIPVELKRSFANFSERPVQARQGFQPVPVEFE